MKIISDIQKQFIIYQIKNITNNKIYIGQTCQLLKTRMSEHKSRAFKKKLNYPLYSSIRKYGIDNFETSILQICKTREEANQAETKFIEEFKTLDRQFGYNIETGGDAKNQTNEAKQKISKIGKQKLLDNPDYLKNGLHSPESRAKAGKALKKTLEARPELIENFIKAVHTPEANAKRAKACKEYYKTHPSPKPMLGKHFSEESKEKMRQTLALTLARKKLLKLLQSKI